MTDQHDGFCDGCRHLPPSFAEAPSYAQAPEDKSADKPAAQAPDTNRCGHAATPPGHAFCFACALKFGACRRCGKPLSLAPSGTGDPDP